MALLLDRLEVMQFLDEVFPQVRESFKIDELAENSIVMRLLVNETHLRPGDTVSGPSMFGLADVAVYAMILGMIGREALTVTTNCSIDFMRKPRAATDLIATGKLLKLGKVLAIGDVHIRSAGSSDIVARATLTYAIPPKA